MMSRRLILVIIAILLGGLLGCKQWDEWRQGVQQRWPGRSPEPIPTVTPEQLVQYLNQQASRLQTITYKEVRLTAREGEGLKGAISYTLRGQLAAMQPRYFHLSAQGGLASGKIDLGSNDEQFWIYVDAPGNKPLYVYASHTDFANGKAVLPGQLPFEPDWVMQTLGMARFPWPGPYDPVKVDEKARTYTLSWPTTTPTGVAIRKEIVFNVDTATGTRPQVRRHVVRDARGKVIGLADIKSVQTLPAGGADPVTGHPYIVQCPTHMLLRWEEQKFELELRLEEVRINQTFTPEQVRGEFSPRISGAVPINLAEARVPAPPPGR